MKKASVLVLALFFILAAASAIQAETQGTEDAQGTAPLFKVNQMVIAGSLENKRPVGIVNVFSSSTEKVHCYVEATHITEDTNITLVWHRNNRAISRITLPLKKGLIWRTNAYKSLLGAKGDWKVDLQDADGKVVKTVGFIVE
ncbi:MAG: DUF2914 domain-containing protein [Nitrospirota bacterium]|nr:DUF2914 domain-containing protein [Nitrospirota bacterium]